MPESKYVIALDIQECALLHTTAADERAKMLRMAAIFHDGAIAEDAPGLDRIARTYAESANRWEAMGRQLEAVNPDLEAVDWVAETPRMSDFLTALRCMGWKLSALTDEVAP